MEYHKLAQCAIALQTKLWQDDPNRVTRQCVTDFESWLKIRKIISMDDPIIPRMGQIIHDFVMNFTGGNNDSAMEEALLQVWYKYAQTL
jgi:hypothetical protein